MGWQLIPITPKECIYVWTDGVRWRLAKCESSAIKSYRQKEWTLGQQVFKNLYSWLATMLQGGNFGGVLVVNTIEFFLEEFTWK